MNLTAERRLGNMQPLRRAGDVLLFRDNHEVAQVAKFHGALTIPKRYSQPRNIVFSGLLRSGYGVST